MRRRLTTALSALALVAVALLGGIGAPRIASADLPDTVSFQSTTHCSNGKPMVGVKAVNADPASPVTLGVAYAFDGAPLGGPSTIQLTTDYQVGGHPDAGGTFRIVFTDDQGAVVHDTGDVDPCAEVQPAVWTSFDCEETAMTATVEVRNLPVGQSVYVARIVGGATSTHLAMSDPQVFTATAGPMTTLRVRVTVGPDTMYDSGDRYVDETGDCNLPVPSVEDGASVTLSSECGAEGADLALAIEGTGTPLTVRWSIGDEVPAIEVTDTFGPGSVATQQAPFGAQVHVDVLDPWRRNIFSAGPLAITDSGSCTAEPVETVAAVVSFECLEGEPVALVGARNDGNVEIGPSVAWVIADSGQHTPDDDQHFEGLLPGETRVLKVPVAPGAPVTVEVSLGGGDKLDDTGIVEATASAPTDCAIDEPEVDDEPEPPAEDSDPMPAPPAGSSGARPLALPASAPEVAVQGAQASREQLPLTGAEPIGTAVSALALLAIGGGLRRLARRA